MVVQRIRTDFAMGPPTENIGTKPALGYGKDFKPRFKTLSSLLKCV